MEYLSPAAFANRITKSAKIASKRAPLLAKAISRKFPRDERDQKIFGKPNAAPAPIDRGKYGQGLTGYLLGRGGGLDHPNFDEDLPGEIDKLTKRRQQRVAKVQRGRGGFVLGKPTRLSIRGFDDDPKPMPRFNSNEPTTTGSSDPTKTNPNKYTSKRREPSYDLGHRVRVGSSGTRGKYGIRKNILKFLKGKLKLDSNGNAIPR